MEFNWIIFPAPSPPTYLKENDLLGRWSLIYIPYENQESKDNTEDVVRTSNVKKEGKNNRYFPWVYIPCEEGSGKVIIYFHGNAEDLGKIVGAMNYFKTYYKWHIIGIEYPGYGIWFNQAKDVSVIRLRAKRTYDFLSQEFGYDEKDIILWGRSLGSGPAIELASITNPSALILVSPYTSLK